MDFEDVTGDRPDYSSLMTLGKVKEKRTKNRIKPMIVPREAKPTIQLIDRYAEMYRDLFVEVRAYDNFKYIIMGMLSEIKRKSLSAIARAVGLENKQGLVHFLTESPWRAEELELKRLRIILEVLQGAEIEVIGDKKKAKKQMSDKKQKKDILEKF